MALEWQWNGSRRSWEAGGRRIYPHKDGTFTIAESDTWLPGCYDSRAVAELAFERDDEFLGALQARKNEEAGGSGGVISLSDLSGEDQNDECSDVSGQGR